MIHKSLEVRLAAQSLRVSVILFLESDSKIFTTISSLLSCNRDGWVSERTTDWFLHHVKSYLSGRTSDLASCFRSREYAVCSNSVMNMKLRNFFFFSSWFKVIPLRKSTIGVIWQYTYTHTGTWSCLSLPLLQPHVSKSPWSSPYFFMKLFRVSWFSDFRLQIFFNIFFVATGKSSFSSPRSVHVLIKTLKHLERFEQWSMSQLFLEYV